MSVFWKNIVKIASASGDPPPVPFSRYNFIEFVSSVKCVSLTAKTDKMICACSAVTFSALLYLFFTSNSADCMTGGRKNILLQGAGYPTYATALRVVPTQCLGYVTKKILA